MVLVLTVVHHFDTVTMVLKCMIQRPISGHEWCRCINAAAITASSLWVSCDDGVKTDEQVFFDSSNSAIFLYKKC